MAKMLDEEDVACLKKKSDGTIVQLSYSAAAKQKEAIKRWHSENCVPVSLRFSKVSDTAILDKLASVSSKTGYIRELILADIGKENEP